jgi:hypothetical protein
MQNFFSTLKTELVYRNSWRTRGEAENAIFSYVDAPQEPHVQSTAVLLLACERVIPLFDGADDCSQVTRTGPPHVSGFSHLADPTCLEG